MTGKRRWLVWTLRLGALVLGLLVIGSGVVVIAGCAAFGRGASGARLARMEASPNWSEGHFVNPQPLRNDFVDMFRGMLDASPHGRPSGPVPTGTGPGAPTPPSGLRVTWFGHSSTLVEIDGHRVLTDPIWSDRASPVSFLGPLRYFPPPVPLAALAPIDAVVISHDHYDHLDRATVIALAAQAGVRFVVPLGMGAHLASWGVAEDRIAELDWWQETKLRNLTIVATPARHASGRKLIDNDKKLWAGYALVGPQHRVYFSGDTGLFPAMRTIGARLGPFDLTMIEVGQYHRAWPDWHVGPEQALRAHRMVGGRALLPVHWGLFTLAYHSWTEPMERVLAGAGDILVLTPRPGESVEPGAPPPLSRWWPTLPGQTAQQHPVVSTQVDQ